MDEMDDDLIDVVLVLAVLFIGIAGLFIVLAQFLKKYLCCRPSSTDGDVLPRHKRSTIRVAKAAASQAPRAAAPVLTSPPPTASLSPTSPTQQFVFIVPKNPSYKQEMIHQTLSAQSSSTNSSYLPSQMAPVSPRRLSF